MNALLLELSHSIRRLRRSSGFALAAVVTLAATLGLNAALFRLIDAVLFRQSPVAHPETLLEIYSSEPGGFLSQLPMSYPDFEDLARRSSVLAQAAAYAWFPVACHLDSGNELLMSEIVSGEFFELLGLRPQRGRLIEPADDREAVDIAVLSDATWRRSFGGDPEIVGREVILNGRTFRVVGIAPRGFRGRNPAVGIDLWLPLRSAVSLPSGVTIQLGRARAGGDALHDRGRLWVWIVGRLGRGVTPTQAIGEIRRLGREIATENPANNPSRHWLAVPASSVRILPEVDRVLWPGSAVAVALFALVLLVASLNLATLMLVRGLRRDREVAIRRALGATRSRLVAELASEGILLALAGALLGLGVSWLLAQWLARLDLPFDWPLTLAIGHGLDLRQVGFVLALGVGAALLFAGLPAVQISRIGPASALRGQQMATEAGGRARTVLLAAQVAASTLLLTIAALLGHSLVKTSELSAGFDTDRLAVLSLAPGLVGRNESQVDSFFRRLTHEVESLPGVVSVSQASHVPLSFAVNFAAVSSDPPASADSRSWPIIDASSVDGDFFDTLGIPVVQGRSLETDTSDARREVVVNQALAAALWPGEANPVGHRLRIAGQAEPYEVVGIARNAKYRTLGEGARSFLYRSLRLDPRGSRSLVVRTSGDPRALLRPLRRLARRIDPLVPLRSAQTYAEILAEGNLLSRVATAVSAAFSGLALLLVGLGIFGVVSQLAAERRRELGIRLALGADPSSLVWWAARRGLLPLLAGWTAGVGLALATTRFLRAILHGIRPVDPPSFAIAALVILVAGTIAALLPARRAVGGDVASSLRAD